MRNWRDFADYRLYMITDASCDLPTTLEHVGKAIAGGVTIVQLRRPGLKDAELTDFAEALKTVLDPLGIPLIVNDNPELAARIGAAGVHVGQNDIAPKLAREIVGPNRIVGLSITAREHVAQIPDGIVDYIGVGPVWPTTSKSDAAPPLGPNGLKEIAELTALPAVAIGGITIENAHLLAGCSIEGICVVSALSRAEDPKYAATRLRDQLAPAGK